MCAMALRLWVLLLAAIGLPAQPRAEFEVASIHLSKRDAAAPAVHLSPGRLNVENLTLRRLILVAYKVRDFQISGGPAWMGTEQFDIDAKTDGKNGADAMLSMLQALLESRFQLRFHRQSDDGAVYLLTVAKSGTRLHQARCVPFDPNDLRKQGALSDAERTRQCGGISRSAGKLDSDGMSLEDGSGPAFQSLAGQLSLVLDRPVVNRTGLAGRFEVHLAWDAEQSTSDGSQPSLFTAVQEQLGLKLEAGRAPVDRFVIDRVEKPGEN
jgi:uncharacterized protein (TIGR03435 family)